MRRTVLIAGCGYVGGALAHRLVTTPGAATEVWALRRRPRPLGSAIHTLAADLTDRSALRQALAPLPPLDTVFYTTAADGREDAAYRAAYVTGLDNLLTTLTALGRTPRQLLYTSSTSVYGQQGGEWVDEDSPTEPEHFTGQRLLEGEALLRGGPCPATVVRFGGIYGPGRTRLIDQVRRGEARSPATAPGEAPLYSNRIHRDDCAGVLHHLLTLDPAERADLYLGVDDDPAPLKDVLGWLAERLEAPEVPMALAPAAGRRGRGNKRCRNQRLRASGYAFLFPTFREGYGGLL